MTLFEELGRRGLIAQMTHPEDIERLLNGKPAKFYIGFDATADSLHVGHFLQLIIIKRMQQAGHIPILLLGTGTTLVGDPTGRTDMRQMLTVEDINYNADRFLEQMGRVVDISPDKAIVERNGDWLLKIGYLDMLRDIGVHFSVNKMLTADCFKSRLEKGLSFIEFNYMIMQSYDFLHLYRKHNCLLEFGGNDQWANIISGVDLVRRVENADVFGMTFSLLLTKDGHKMGKTMGGAVWLDPNKTSPYDFFQYWRNVDDAEVINCLKMLTFVPIEEIEAMEAWEGSQLNKAKEILAFELTKEVHGEEEAAKALEASRAIFVGGSDSVNMPTTQLEDSDLTDGAIDILELMVKAGLTASKAEARRLIQQKGVSVDSGDGEFQPVEDIAFSVTKEQLSSDKVIVRKGKKIFHKVKI
ncbi:MAG: tyrosine--tRNA ligase [Oscillospiraceae bacterium]